jgi:hypothetical protein
MKSWHCRVQTQIIGVVACRVLLNVEAIKLDETTPTTLASDNPLLLGRDGPF